METHDGPKIECPLCHGTIWLSIGDQRALETWCERCEATIYADGDPFIEHDQPSSTA